MFSKNLKFLREKKNMEQLELAEMLGRKSSSSISEWEKGKYTPRIGTLNDIAKIFKVDIDDLMTKDLSKNNNSAVPSIEIVYNQLEKPRQTKVYNFAEQQLEEQNSNVVQFPIQNNHEEVQAYLSAGTGILNYYEADKDIVEVPADAPEHDWIFKIVGDSMKPLFDTGDIVYVDEFKQGTDTIQNGRIYVVEVDGEAYIKKVYVYEETKTLRLVSLNKDYIDLLFRFEDSDIKFIGRVII